MAPNAFLVHDPDRVTTEISDVVGTDDEKDVLGVVFDLGDASYTGGNYTDLWEWLKKRRRAG